MNAHNAANYANVGKARELQKTLYLCAKVRKTRRFHALYDKIYRPDILWEAWQRVKRNRGSGGVDRQTLEDIEEYGERCFLNELYLDLKENRYHPKPVLRTYIPKSDGKKQRPLGIPTVTDRIVQMAMKLVIEPIFEADFQECSYGFRPKRNAHQAIEAIRKKSRKAHWVLDVDIQGFFDNINQEKLLKLVEQRISDRRVLKLIRKWLKAGIMEEGKLKNAPTGTPQGGVISPLLANIYLNAMDQLWQKKFRHLGTLIRYADDFVIMCRRKRDALESAQAVKAIMNKLDLSIHRDKSKLVSIWDDKEGFDFLGLHHRKFPVRRKGGRTFYFMQHVPSHQAMKKMRAKIKAFTEPRHKLYMDIRDLVEGLNRRLQGFKNYYQLSPMGKKWLNRIDWYVLTRLKLFNNKKKNRRKKHAHYKEVEEIRFLLVKLAG
ncbi:group II intron reverse transcriptase/maturase [Alkalicoccus urumqiensis]|uniref:Group II intron reverse transcriptase/maturase n=1 Tax=Alkalicoccus urumqiensis TaxID=1548213 RepID=A0A2P6MD85_ALKUR|nr:group II intron reverse transcriptase/maturase [Alkalicoccus urumqiensis]PRO64232.1 group II intron reverse transcriptase/maturase [Alkalicoccus urumqiensis]